MERLFARDSRNDSGKIRIPDRNRGKSFLKYVTRALVFREMCILLVAYKAEIDLSDEGSIKMLDAYARVFPMKDLNFTIGQMRVPFTIDAHRSPHQQYFANRSFIAKQVGNVRDVGFTTAYKHTSGFPFILEAGLFNGSGLTNQKNGIKH